MEGTTVKDEFSYRNHQVVMLKRILLIGAHPDDDHQSHGTLTMLTDHGNDVTILQ